MLVSTCLTVFAVLSNLALATKVEIDANGIYDSIRTPANHSLLAQRSDVEMLNPFAQLDKRQSCQAGYGTCPGGTTCGCPTNAGCCGGSCTSRDNTCCVKRYLCPPGWGCCEADQGDNCYPISSGAQCCFDGSYCYSGSSCVRYDGVSTARCRVYGATSSYVEPSYSTVSSPPRATSTSRRTTAIGDYEEYTVTFIIYYTSYFLTSRTYNYASATTTYSVDYSLSSTTLSLSTSASNAFAARQVLSSIADASETSLDNSASSTSLSLSSQASRSAAAASSSARSSSSAGTGGSVSGGGGGASTGTTLSSHGIFVVLVASVIGVASLMIYL